MQKNSTSIIFLTLGLIWLIVGLFIYPNSGVWPLGIIFFIIGIIIKIGSVKF
ncbi:hypothetical protein SAMN04515667_1592 [Formosa sp. Hel1_31_208]|uniref:hypothetical protein n=1 Tax=Formosa sp. Hel1_31_208 TaxID=1798225 RepID=UPI000879D2E9|nr:hypothetical protein [Formosa sp. Hel1_31_208]SDS18183.1 hypothetical protein SAMN04515667_1592 [Formosa sp. Hel1_31_208]